MGRIIGTLILSIWITYIGVMYESEQILVLAFAIFVFWLISMIDLLIRYFSIQAWVAIPLNVAEVGGNVNVQVFVKNMSPFAVPKIRYEIITRNLFLKDKFKSKVFGEIVIPGKNQLSYGMIPMEAGNYEIELKSLYIFNTTGSFWIKKRIKKSAFLQVNPSIVSMSVGLTEATRNFYGEGDSYNDLKAGNDPSETFQIREFRNGDKLQKIHWKLSAKMDDLVVKEDSEPKSCPVVIFLNYQVPDNKKNDVVDAYLGAIGSLSFSLLDENCYHYVSWYSVKNRDIVRVRVWDEESYFFMLASYLNDAYEKSPEPLRSLYKKKFKGEHYLFAFEINEQLLLSRNGKVICSLNKDSWKRDLEGLEIII